MISHARSRGRARSRTARLTGTDRSPGAWPARVVEAWTEASPVATAAGIAVVLGASWGTTWWMGGAGAVAPHWFYFAIVLAGARFGVVGAVVTAVLSGLLVGPLMPLDVGEGTPQRVGDWASRAAFFVVLGALVAVLVERVATVRIRLGDVWQRERHLARQRVAFIDGISHEFRTPLTVIAGSAQMLKRGNIDASDHPELVDGLCRNIDRLEALLDVLIVAGEGTMTSEGSELVVADLTSTLVEQIHELAPLSAPARVRIRWHEPVLVRGDRRLISIAIASVLDNALRYSGEHALVDCDVDVTAGTVSLRVRDRGPGIDPKLARECLAAPFAAGQSAGGAGDHVGVGLFAAGQAVQRVGGAVDVDRAEHGGTEVVFTLRRA